MSKTRFSMKWDDTQTPEVPRSAEPVALEDYKPRRESLIEAAMDATLQERTYSQSVHERSYGQNVQDRSYSHDEVRLEMPIQARLETRRDVGDETVIDIPIEAQRDVALGFANLIPQTEAAEHFEALKANLWARYSETAMKVVLFVGATSGSGASTAAANFAAMLAQDAATRVLLIDANLRTQERSEPLSDDISQRAAGVSLARLLAGPRAPVYPVPGPSNLYVLPSGTKCSMPLSLFQSSAFDDFLKSVRQRFQYVVIDAPPLQGFPESLVLSRKADGVILVVESEKTRKRTALWAKQQIEAVGGKLLGVVLNKRKYYIPDWLYRRI
jgi:protein-tyrosine kinase